MKLLNFLIICCIGFVISSCASGPQYIPSELKNQSASNLAELIIDLHVRDIHIDGQKVKSNQIFLNPGKHSIKYKVIGRSEHWESMVKSMERKGFILSSDGSTFVKGGGFSGGLTQTVRPLSVSRFGWHENSKKISVEAGKKYRLSSI